MKKSKTLLVLSLMVCLCVLLASCDGSVSSKDDKGGVDASDMVYVPQFQLTSASKAIVFNELIGYFGGGLAANNAAVLSMNLPSLIGFTEKNSSDALFGYTQNILGKDVSILCTREDDGSYMFEGSTTDDSIYVRTVVRKDNSVDYLEMKKFDVDDAYKMIVVTNGTIKIDPSKEYQTGIATVYCAADKASAGFNAVCSAQLYLSDKISATVTDSSEGYSYGELSSFDSHYGNIMNYETVLAFVEDVTSVEPHISFAGKYPLNLSFHVFENNAYAQNIYKDDSKHYVLPESSDQSNNSNAETWADMQDYVSFITDGNWTLEY